MIFTPLKMRPYYRETLWGGYRLKSEYNKHDAPDCTAESWELACNPSGDAVVSEGPLAGNNLRELAEIDRTGFWGADCRGKEFPILVKLIDAAKELSIQVHPSDENADISRGERGKEEMWYIVDCKPTSAIYFGFSGQTDAAEVLERARNGTICSILNRVPVKRGDVFNILPGTIHAIGEGVLVAEVQQNSDTTFRVYDYCRTGADDRQRELNLERAISVMNFAPIIPEECRPTGSVIFPEFVMTELFSGRYFRVNRFDVLKSVKLKCEGDSFRHLLCVEGAGRIICRGTEYPFCRGESYFLPAALVEYVIEGKCRLLISRV